MDTDQTNNDQSQAALQSNQPAPQSGTTDLAAELLELKRQNQQMLLQMQMFASQQQNAIQIPQQIQQQPEPQYSYDDFVNNPAQLINSAVSRQIAPLQESLNIIKRNNIFEGLKALAIQHPQVAQIWNHISPMVEGFIRGQVMPHRDPTQQDMEHAITNAIGRLTMLGGIPANPTPQQIPQQQTTQQVPPTVRPSLVNPTNNQNQPQGTLRQLNETEIRVARESRMGAAEYLYFMGEITPEVAKSHGVKL